MDIIRELPAWLTDLPLWLQVTILAVSFLVIIATLNANKATVIISPHAVNRAKSDKTEEHLIRCSKIFEKWTLPFTKRTFHLDGTYFKCIVVSESQFDDDLKKVAANLRRSGEKGPFLGITTCFLDQNVNGHYSTKSRSYDDNQ